MIKTIKSLLLFIKNPNQIKINSTKDRLFQFLTLFVLNILLAICLIQVYKYLVSIGFDELKNHANIHVYTKENIPILFFLGILIIPFYEETVYRLSLVFNKWSLSISLLLSLFIFYHLISSKLYFYGFLIIIIGIVIGLIFNKKIEEYIRNVWNKRFRLIFYCFTLLFALVHASNYKELSLSVILLMPVLLFGQFVGGIIMGYIRLKMNFFLGIVYHGLFNAVFFIFYAITDYHTPVNLNHTTDQYQLQLSDTTEKDNKDKFSSISIDSIIIQNHSLLHTVALLTNKEESQIHTEKYIMDKIFLNLHYYPTSELSDSTTHNNQVIKELKKAYDFEIIKQHKKISTLKLHSFDKGNKLAKYISSDRSLNSNMNITDTDFIFQNVTIPMAIKSINTDGNLEKIIVTDIENTARYNLTIPKISIEKLNIYLEVTYGLRLTEIVQDVEILELEFD